MTLFPNLFTKILHFKNASNYIITYFFIFVKCFSTFGLYAKKLIEMKKNEEIPVGLIFPQIQWIKITFTAYNFGEEREKFFHQLSTFFEAIYSGFRQWFRHRALGFKSQHMALWFRVTGVMRVGGRRCQFRAYGEARYRNAMGGENS